MKAEVRIIQGDAAEVLGGLESESVHCVVTSPPYWFLRDYGGGDAQIGLEETPEAHAEALVKVFREVRRVLRPDGTLWLNYGDSYNTCNGGPGQNAGRMWARRRRLHPGGRGFGLKVKTLKRKDLIGLGWRLAFALQADGWWLRNAIVWVKTNPPPESATDRLTRSHENVFLLTKSANYHFDRRVDAADVWQVSRGQYKEAHTATFPPELVQRCIEHGCPAGGVVLDPFSGSGTTAIVAAKMGHDSIGIELEPEYVEIAKRRLGGDMFISVNR